jgi:hypothetical protein
MKTFCVILLGAVGLVAAGCGGNNETATTTTTTAETPTVTATTKAPPVTQTTPTTSEQRVTIRIEGGKPVGGVVHAKIKKGQHVLLIVRSNVADEVHVHGYDVMQDVAASGTARIRFKASIPGIFVVELESRGLQIAELTVQ